MKNRLAAHAEDWYMLWPRNFTHTYISNRNVCICSSRSVSENILSNIIYENKNLPITIEWTHALWSSHLHSCTREWIQCKWLYPLTTTAPVRWLLHSSSSYWAPVNIYSSCSSGLERWSNSFSLLQICEYSNPAHTSVYRSFIKSLL